MRYVYCHPLFDERKCAHRFSWELARKMAEYGIFLERFDYKGTGEGEGDFCDVTVETMVDDLKNYIDGECCVLIGLRVGGAIAVKFADENEDLVKKLILIEPVTNGDSYLEHIRRKQQIKDMMTGNAPAAEDDGYENIEGYKTNVKLLEQLGRIDIKKAVVDTTIITANKKTLNSNFKIVNVKIPALWERIGNVSYTELMEKVMEVCIGKNRIYE